MTGNLTAREMVMDAARSEAGGIADGNVDELREPPVDRAIAAI